MLLLLQITHFLSAKKATKQHEVVKCNRRHNDPTDADNNTVSVAVCRNCNDCKTNKLGVGAGICMASAAAMSNKLVALLLQINKWFNAQSDDFFTQHRNI